MTVMSLEKQKRILRARVMFAMRELLGSASCARDSDADATHALHGDVAALVECLSQYPHTLVVELCEEFEVEAEALTR